MFKIKKKTLTYIKEGQGISEANISELENSYRNCIKLNRKNGPKRH